MNQRRSFLKASIVLASASGLPMIGKASTATPAERKLSLYNTHTGETVSRVFWAQGQFDPDALQDINKVLRDHRTNAVAPIDPQLLFLLDQVNTKMDSNKTLHIISGYRSPESNAMLNANTTGVAKHSMHMDGKAIDIRMPGRNLAQLREAAMSLRGGGVGYYPDSQFVHLDTGRLRSW
ncbi:MAG TPA: DUF882 domain-containing protein [Telluria sp.]